MNYEDKYKQALERARDVYTYYCDDREQLRKIESIFPELKESEDERIREEIIAFLRSKNGYMTPNEDWDFHNRWLAWLEKQDEQTTDKVEPKFKVGDWVIKNGIVAQILDKQKYGFVGLDIDGKDFFCNYGHTDSMRLWSINDAKDGDVLVDGKDGRPFIFTGNFDARDDNPIAYCGINSIKKFMISSGSHWTFRDRVKPATKEQRDLLFSKMKEAGYEWNAEKKELKKIEGKKLDADKVIEWLDKNAPKWLYDTVYPIRLDVDAEDLIKQFKQDFDL